MKNSEKFTQRKREVANRIEEMRDKLNKRLEDGYPIEECQKLSEELDDIIAEHLDLLEEEMEMQEQN